VNAPLDPDKALLAPPCAEPPGGRRLGALPCRSGLDGVQPRDRGGADAQAAFREVMTGLAANGFSRLKDYDGRARVRVYVALVVRDLLLERALNLLVLDAARGWPAFEAFFGQDMRRMIERALPGTATGRTARTPTRRFARPAGQRSAAAARLFGARQPLRFVLHIIENLVVDFVRTIIPRRRLPAAIERLPALDQSIYRLVYWDRLDAEPAILLRICRTPARGAEPDGRRRGHQPVRQALPPATARSRAAMTG